MCAVWLYHGDQDNRGSHAGDMSPPQSNIECQKKIILFLNPTI